MARPTNAARAAKLAESEAAAGPIPRLIYVPQEGDPAETVWNRHRFQANVPTEIRDVRNGLTAAQMLAAAKGNPWFQIEGQSKKPTLVVSVPTTAEQYRTYAAIWIRDAKTSKGLVARWESEQELRADCEVGGDDVEYLTTLFNPRKTMLERAEKLAASQADN